MITKKQIEKAKMEVILKGSGHHVHDDCIRIAYEWLDAQQKTKNPRNVPHDLKHLIEQWAGRYVSQSDVEIAAHLHPEILGSHPFYNISSRLTEPSVDRLKNIAQAFTQGQRAAHQVGNYSVKE